MYVRFDPVKEAEEPLRRYFNRPLFLNPGERKSFFGNQSPGRRVFFQKRLEAERGWAQPLMPKCSFPNPCTEEEEAGNEYFLPARLYKLIANS